MIKNLVFDFGGVIVDIDRENAVKAFEELGIMNADELLDKYHQRGIFLEAEDGRINADEFCKRLGEIAGRPISFAEAQRGWLGYMVSDPRKRLAYLQELRKKYRIYILSNTNPFILDWACGNQFTPDGKPLDAYVDHIVASYKCKCVKPNDGIFQTLIQETGLNPAETIFIDDGAANTKKGEELGFHTLLAVNGEDWFTALEEMLEKL